MARAPFHRGERCRAHTSKRQAEECIPSPSGPEASGSEAPVRAAAHTKPGYSSFCEAMAQDVGPIVVKREGFAEAPALEQGLRRHSRHLEIEQASVHLGDWQLDTPLLRAGFLSSSGASDAAKALAG